MKELYRVFLGSLVYNLYTVEYSRTLIICKEPTKVLENSYGASFGHLAKAPNLTNQELRSFQAL